jgi:phenylpropionate dioxygenase-like ring-hydroxylating dioxygenase large terminal subunit
MIDHWHPVLLSHELRRKPQLAQVAGQEVAVFRTASGKVAALREECPHRRMRLSRGSVIGEKLQCRYHGWLFSPDGRGESPGTPKLHACAEHFDTREEHGVVWVKPSNSEAKFPILDVAGYFPMGALRHEVAAPLELAVDNFCEIEHTPTTHAVFGYDLERMHEVEVRFEPADDAVRVINVGPPKKIGFLLRAMIGFGKDWVFNDDWTTRFSPVYSQYDHWWSDPATGKESTVRWRLFIFFVPINEGRTSLITLSFARSRWPGPAGCLRPFRWLMQRLLSREIELDVEILEGLASQETGIEGMKLSRFDRVLGLNRERIQRIYRGLPTGAAV